MKPSTRIPRKKKKKMALYEVFNRGMSNSKREQELEQLQSEGSDYIQTPKVGQYRPKVRMLQLNRGRVEISIRFDVAIVLVLLAIVCVMAAYRLGERLAINNAASGGSVETATPAIPAETVTENEMSAPVAESRNEPVVETETESEAATGSGDNWIVIATHENEGQLAAVQQFFAGYGIETQIRKIGDNFILHTTQTYGNPNRSGTDGERMRQRIVEIGENYRPLPGYKTFDFRTAYGMKKLN
jgi:hypothetical protein